MKKLARDALEELRDDISEFQATTKARFAGLAGLEISLPEGSGSVRESGRKVSEAVELPLGHQQWRCFVLWLTSVL